MAVDSPRPSHTDPHSAAGAIELILSLRHPRCPATRKVPWPVRRLLPDPLRHWERLTHADIANLSRDDRRREAFRFRVALAQVDSLDDVCSWVFDRLRHLDSPAGDERHYAPLQAPARPTQSRPQASPPRPSPVSGTPAGPAAHFVPLDIETSTG
jgi:hypothetical protein